MKPGGEFGLEKLVHKPVPRDTVHATKTITYYGDGEMGLISLNTVASGMMRMAFAVITYDQLDGLQLRLELGLHTRSAFLEVTHEHSLLASITLTTHINPIMQRKSTRHRAFDPDPDAPERYCDMPNCTEHAGYRAPKDRTQLRQYFWFCLDHVRQYNARWDFYKGMTPGQIEAQLRADISWQRPSWKLGTRGGQSFDEEEVLDPLDILSSTRAKRAQSAKRRHQQAQEAAPPGLRDHLRALALDWPLTVDTLKTRYKELARKHHPDANAGDPAAEDRFKTVSVAYSAIRAHLISL